MDHIPLMPQHAHYDGQSSESALSIDAIWPIGEQQHSPSQHEKPHERIRTATERPHETSRALSNSVPDGNDEKKGSIVESPSTRLQRFPNVVRLAFAYAVLAIFAWTITCILVNRPLTTQHYGLWLKDGDPYGYRYPSSTSYSQNERWWQVARVVQAVVAVLSIPLASAVCSNAAVVFIQRKCKNKRFSLRQTIVLADKGWTEYEVYSHLLRGRWKQYGSTLLYLAIALNILGGVLSPLQSVFTTTATIQGPAYLGRVQKLTDIPDLFSGLETLSDTTGPARLRAALISTSNTDPQSRLWSTAGAFDCANTTDDSSAACAFGQISLSNMSQLQDPFLAQLPAGYSTGLVRQFLPRINSSVTRDRISEAEFPTGCESMTGSFYVNYSTTVMIGYEYGEPVGLAWSLIACMPANQRETPWTSTRERQDFSEQMYLNLSAWSPPSTDSKPAEEWSGYFKITLNTTAGYFELPNYKNGQTPGPLLSNDPSEHCGRDCISQGDYLSSKPSIYDHNNTKLMYVRDVVAESNGTSPLTDAAYSLTTTSNKGPLLTVAMALFGPGSFVADRVAHPEAYVSGKLDATLTCIERAPFLGLLSVLDDDSTHTAKTVGNCITNSNWNFGFLQQQIVDYVQAFIYLDDRYSTSGPTSDERITNAFEAAAFLANQQWLTSATQATFTVSYDAGISIQIPRISSAGIVVISTLLGIYLMSLLAMALYSNWDPHWTGRLDSLAMMQLGAAIAEHLPLHVVVDTAFVNVLDETPGWIGDVTGGEGAVGELALGACAPLNAKRKYRCFEFDRKPGIPSSSAESQRSWH